MLLAQMRTMLDRLQLDCLAPTLDREAFCTVTYQPSALREQPDPIALQSIMLTSQEPPDMQIN